MPAITTHILVNDYCSLCKNYMIPAGVYQEYFFRRGGRSHFSQYFPSRYFQLVTLRIFQCFLKVTTKKSLESFSVRTFFIFLQSFSVFPHFLLNFPFLPFFPSLLFPNYAAKKFSGGKSLFPLLPACYATGSL